MVNEGFTVEDKRGTEKEPEPEKPQEQEVPAPPPAPSFLARVVANDVLGPWIKANMFPQFYRMNPNTGLVEFSQWVHPDMVIPWIMVNNDATRMCDWYKHVDLIHDFIPKPCMECWKVVVMPKTLKQLFQLLNVEKEMVEQNPYCFCKCGIELRKDVERNYGGYFYCNDLKQGLTRLEEVKERVHKQIGEDVPVILKRSCTEFERKYGPSDKWDTLFNAEHDRTWKRLCEIFRLEKRHTRQPVLVQNHVMVTWIEYAASIGDPTIPELNNGEKVFPGYVIYEPSKEN